MAKDFVLKLLLKKSISTLQEDRKLYKALVAALEDNMNNNSNLLLSPRHIVCLMSLKNNIKTRILLN